MDKITIAKNLDRLNSISDKVTILDELKLTCKEQDEIVNDIEYLLKAIKNNLLKELK